MKKQWVLGLIAMVSACDAEKDVESSSSEAEVATSRTCDYPQAFGTPQHTGIACKELHGMRVAAVITQDPDADAENDFSGFLQIHESPPLTSGDWVVVPSKQGFTDGFNRQTESYSVQAFRWFPSVSALGATLRGASWTADTDWHPVDGVVEGLGGPGNTSIGFANNGYVQQFAPAIGNGSVYLPAASGKLRRVSLTTGATQAVIDPLAGTAFDGDPQTTVNNAISIVPGSGDDTYGTVYYTVVAWPTGPAPFGQQPRGSWLVQVRPDNSVTRVDWSAIATAAVGVPQARDLCEYPFTTSGTPEPTGPDSRPPLFGCGVQRPGMNTPIAARPNGNLVAYSYANNAFGISFLIEINPTTLTPIRAADTRGHLLHGCGVRLPINPLHDFDGCSVITAAGTVNLGNDPEFNGPVRFRGEDLVDSAPAIAPDGSAHVCGYDNGFSFGGEYDARGACVGFDANFAFRDKNEIFGWEVTPTVWSHIGATGFSFLSDQNKYSQLSLGVAQYSPTMVQQEFGTVPLAVGTVAVDFLDANIAVDTSGTHYGMNGDGHLYKFGADGTLLDSVALTNSDGSVRSMETLSGYFARDRAGRIYASYAGNVYVIEESGQAAAQAPHLAAPTARQLAGMAAKRTALRRAVAPPPPPGD